MLCANANDAENASWKACPALQPEGAGGGGAPAIAGLSHRPGARLRRGQAAQPGQECHRRVRWWPCANANDAANASWKAWPALQPEGGGGGGAVSIGCSEIDTV